MVSLIIIVQALHENSCARLRLKARGCNPGARFSCLLAHGAFGAAIFQIIIVQALHESSYPRLRLKARGCNPDARFSCLQIGRAHV